MYGIIPNANIPAFLFIKISPFGFICNSVFAGLSKAPNILVIWEFGLKLAGKIPLILVKLGIDLLV